MKFYISKKFYEYVDSFKDIDFYSIHAFGFLFCLLPLDVKEKILNNFDPLTRNTFKTILEVNDTYVDNIEECDFSIVCIHSFHDFNFSLTPFNKDTIRESLKNGKKILFFYGGDDNRVITLSNDYGYLFRSSGFLSESGANTFGFPTFNNDFFVEKYCGRNLTISFCGCPYTSTGEIASGTKYEGIRSDVIRNLKDKKYSDFILRNKWMGRTQEYEHRRDFFKNINENLYGLCVRGGGNFSFRLGEVFMMGRIPILINTDCILPFVDDIDYKRNTILITPENSNNFNDIEKIIFEYHEQKTENELYEIQKENRKIWENYFTPKGAFDAICSMLNKLNENSM